MWGQVLELKCDQPEAAMQVLQSAQAAGIIDIGDLSFYGAQIHAVVPDASVVQEPIRRLLAGAGLQVTAVERITPTLEDVFIASIRQPPVLSEVLSG